MPTPSKATGSGTKAFISTDGTAFQEFASVTKLGGPSMSRGTVDVTDMNSFSNNNQFKEFLNDFIEADEAAAAPVAEGGEKKGFDPVIAEKIKALATPRAVFPLALGIR